MATFVYSKNDVTLTIETDDDFDPNLTYALDFFESIFEDVEEDEYDEDEWEEDEEE